jgi:hypothetical protein
MLGGWECGMTSDTDDLEKQLQEKLKLRSELGNLEEQLQQNLKLRRELGAKVAKTRDRNAKDRLDIDKRKLLNWAPHEYLDSVFHPRRSCCTASVEPFVTPSPGSDRHAMLVARRSSSLGQALANGRRVGKPLGRWI